MSVLSNLAAFLAINASIWRSCRCQCMIHSSVHNLLVQLGALHALTYGRISSVRFPRSPNLPNSYHFHVQLGRDAHAHVLPVREQSGRSIGFCWPSILCVEPTANLPMDNQVQFQRRLRRKRRDFPFCMYGVHVLTWFVGKRSPGYANTGWAQPRRLLSSQPYEN
jgi:hypothetical protein